MIDDYIGNLIEKGESLTKGQSGRIKKFFQKMSLNQKPGLLDKIMMFVTMAVAGLTFRDMYDLYLKYVGNWGAESVTYRFDGYSKKTKEWSITKGAANRSILSVKADEEKLCEKDTWDTTRVVVKCLDEFENERLFASDVIEITVTGAASLIGPNKVSLIAGSTAFWIRSIGKNGVAEVEVSSQFLGEKKIEVEVEKFE